MKQRQSVISSFQRHLSLWVLLCMVVGVVMGHYIPAIPEVLSGMEIAGISIPIAVLIWVMIYPMMMKKVDFQSIKQIGRNPKGLFVTWIANWLVKPFTMYISPFYCPNGRKGMQCIKSTIPVQTSPRS